jgi:hypothetical protein
MREAGALPLHRRPTRPTQRESTAIQRWNQSKLDVEYDNAFERCAHQSGRALVTGMRPVGVKARAIDEVHGEPVREADVPGRRGYGPSGSCRGLECAPRAR